MSQQDKGRYFRALKADGVEFKKHYREYTTEELRTNWEALHPGATLAPEPQAPPAPAPQYAVSAPHDAFADFVAQQAAVPQPPVRERDPNEMAGQRLNTHDDMQPLRTDENGRVWYQEEVLKPAFAKPRGRRVLTYTETGTQQQTVVGQDGFTETFEVAGGGAPRAAEVKITLPSYQVGVYKDPRLPFKVHTYNGNQGFDFFEVQDYYNGPELVPEECKRIYVENVLCYDMRTVVRAIEDEYRHMQLTGRIQ